MSIKDCKLYIVGIGPGYPDLMTVAAQQAILESDYVIGNTTYLDQIEPLLPGKKVITSSMGEEIARARHALELASGGNTVSIISGGDAGVYGMAGIVLEIAEKDGADANAGGEGDGDAGTLIQVRVHQSERSADAVGGYREEDLKRCRCRLCDRSL